MDGNTTTTELHGNTKVSRDDWLRAARKALISHGVGEVKILSLARLLGVSRSSFYWHFESRRDLLDQLIQSWERRNTGIMLKHCELPAETITDAVMNFFRCIIDPAGFDPKLDFAMREWARRDETLRAVIDRSDEARRGAIARMFERHGFSAPEADIRARVLYYQQIGYYALDLRETLRTRMERVEGYLYCFTGEQPDAGSLEVHRAFVDGLMASDRDGSG